MAGFPPIIDPATGRPFNFNIPAEPVASPIPTVTPAQSLPKPGLLARVGAKAILAADRLPGAGSPVVSGAAKALAKFSLAAAPLFGAAGAVAEDQQDTKAFADSLDINYDSFGGRILANSLNFLNKTGNAATFGAAGKLGQGLSRVSSGGSFFEPAKAPTPAGARPVPTIAPTVTQLNPADEPAELPTIPLDDETPRSGSGFVFRPRDGRIFNAGGDPQTAAAAPNLSGLGAFGKLFATTALLSEQRRADRIARKQADPDTQLKQIQLNALGESLGALTPQQKARVGLGKDPFDKEGQDKFNVQPSLDGQSVTVVSRGADGGFTAEALTPTKAGSGVSNTIIADLKAGRLDVAGAQARFQAAIAAGKVSREDAAAALKAAGFK